jgi:N-acetylneuraminate synthase
MRDSITIAATQIGSDHAPFVVAEMSGNHNGDLDRALAIVEEVAASGAHALKLQTYTPDTITIDVDSDSFRVAGAHELWGGRRLYDLYAEAQTPWEWHEPIFELARNRGLAAFSAPFDPTAVAFLEGLDVPAYKVASAEIVDLPLVRTMAATGKPIIISTGMASLSEIDRAVQAARETGNEQVIVLRCTASYPAPAEESNLRAIPLLGELLGTQVGLSDHTAGIGVAIAAVALGATVIEKHVTLSRADGGVDAAFSLEPDELARLVRETAAAWAAVGEPTVGPRPTESSVLRLRRSLYVTQDVKAGDRVGTENVRSIRPAGGLAPDLFDTVRGRQFRVDVAKGTPVTWDII